MMKKTSSAFTLIELLVVISIIAVLAAVAVPALTSALTRGQMTGTMNNLRQLHLVGLQMAVDGAATSDPNYSWPGDDAAITTLEGYISKLSATDYLKPGDIQKILTAPGTTCVVNSTTASGTTTVTLTGKPALKVYKVKDIDGTNTIFCISANYAYGTALTAAGVPYGDKGFIVVRKGGDGAVYRRNQATTAGWSNDAKKFQAAIGRKPGDGEGVISTDDTTVALTNPP